MHPPSATGACSVSSLRPPLHLATAGLAFEPRRWFCLVATATVLELPPTASSQTATSCPSTGCHASGRSGAYVRRPRQESGTEVDDFGFNCSSHDCCRWATRACLLDRDAALGQRGTAAMRLG